MPGGAGPSSRGGLARSSSACYRRLVIAYDRTGSLIVLSEGAELLVHDGPSEGPLWRRSDGGAIVAVGAADGAAIAVDEAGFVRWYDARREQLQAAVEAGVHARGAAVASNGEVAVFHDGGIRVVTRVGIRVDLELPEPAVAGWSADGRLLFGMPSGKIGEVDGRGEMLRGLTLKGEPIVGVAYNPLGFWVVASASRLARIDDGPDLEGRVHHLTGMPDDLKVRDVTCSERGELIAFSLGEREVAVMAWPSRESAGSLEYPERRVTNLAFGPDRKLAVGLDLGDGNKFDLRARGLARTDTHPGREHHRWLVSVSCHPEKITDAPARPAAPAPGRVAYAPPAEATPTKSRAMTVVVVVVVVIFVVWLYLAVQY